MTGPTPSRTNQLTPADRDWIAAEVARAPLFTADQRAKLAELLRPVRKSRAAG